ncbi:ATP-binding protein [Sphingomonas sp. CCH10-B3]|uniref:ATP-binding protein n=1 Tax=Sphingomonas sp. CCH10-B3 TaxID=1768757 RepID=UPI00082EA8B7|nr:ATP-binding protein [Sphingomonas sp. CCH10-B3]
MKIRLFTLTFLLIAGTALLGELTMAGVMAINLQRGFTDYLAANDRERFNALIGMARDEGERRGGLAAFRRGDFTLPQLIHAVRPGPPRGRRGRPPPPDDLPPPPRRGPPPEAIERRLIIRDATDRILEGPPLPRRRDKLAQIVRRDVVLGGEVIGSVAMVPRGRPAGGVDARFLTSQYQGAALLALLLLAVSLLPAWLIARWGERTAREMVRATDAIAAGDFAARASEAAIGEVTAVAQNINRMAETLGRLETARRRWLAEVSHELRTPLAAIRGELDALVDGVRPLSMAAIASVQEEALSLGRLVEDLHFLAMADLARPPCRFESCDAVALCRDAAARFAVQAAARGIEVSVDTEGRAAFPVLWDGARIEQLLANALTNSLRYTDVPGRVALTLSVEGAHVQLLIDDSPPGVPAEALAQLFEPLYRLDEARDRARGGSGLGLAVSDAIVRAHGGSIAAEASPLGGLRLRIKLPIEARA